MLKKHYLPKILAETDGTGALTFSELKWLAAAFYLDFSHLTSMYIISKS